MYCGNLDETHLIIRLAKGEDLIASLKQIVQNHRITNASVAGIGSLENPTLAHYRVDTKQYHEVKIDGIFEVLSLLGNCMQSPEGPIIHLHTTISDEQMHALGGHVVSATVSATMEIILTVFPSEFSKSYSEEIGLKLLDLQKCEMTQ